ncbi:hypothetical protein CASFOL_011345 [Castilleja foliolosa]|uniref:GDSL esterase/lipase n=1 Tax=Castilleja foliolosa TaxID=1961234 RepID=A0ABD3DZ72_9LAMI
MEAYHVSIIILMSFVCTLLTIQANAKAQVTSMFVFGDSLSDPGNNINFVMTVAKTKYWPYGIDFEKGPTGRYSNGKIFVDYIGELLGLPIVSSYVDSTTNGADIMFGVNYASAGAGILDETGLHFGKVIPLREQVDNFKNTLNQLRVKMQTDELSNYLAKSVAFMAIGSNDYLNNYILPPFYQSSLIYNPQQFADILIKIYTTHILELQNLGFRKFLIVEVAPIGCIPAVVALGLTRPSECEWKFNDFVRVFNARLKSLVYRLNSDNPGSLFTLAATFEMFMDLRNNSDAHGFTVKDKACCAIGIDNGKPVCLPQAEPCFNREQYLFWDDAHPTQAANRNFAYTIFNSTTFCFPITIQKMGEM